MTEFDVGVDCPACGAHFKAPRIRRGSIERCPVCAFGVAVPGGSTYEEVVAPPGQEHAAPAAEVEAGPVAAAAPQAVPGGAATGRCVVCLEREQKYDFTKVSAIVDELDGHITLESRIQIAKGKGVLAEDLPAAAAEMMVARLAAAGVPAFAVDKGVMPSVSRELPVQRIHGVDADALRVETRVRGDVRLIPMRSLAAGFCTKLDMVRGGPTDLKAQHYVMFPGVGNVPVARTVYRAARRPPAPEMQCTLVVFGASGNCYAMRFSRRQVRYAYLGDRLTSSVSRNFCAFLQDVMRHGAHAFFPDSWRAVAAGNQMRAVRLKGKGEDEYWWYVKWILCNVARRWQMGAEEP